MLGRQNYNNYAGPGWTHYTIPVGSYFTGAFVYVTFANDHDLAPANGRARFRNVRIHE